MKKARTILPVLVCLVILAAYAAGRQTAEEEEKDSTTGIQIEQKDGKEYFVFQDVKENSYRAELLDDVPKNTYDFDCLTVDETTGFKQYNDKANGITSRMGIDVSEFQGEDIDWKLVKDSGIEFVIIRAGYRAYGETGELVQDAMFEQNIEGALDAGLDVGVYFFSQAITPGEAVEEAEFVLDLIRPYEITGPVVYDTEEIKGDTARTDDNTRQEFTNYCKVFCDTVEHAGYDSMIYANMKWMAFTLDMEELTDYDFWYADYHELPQNPYEYTIWQYSETGEVPGINANVDLNIWFEKEG
ncbi:Lyzozyme M1 (1,4-beta-N-acetylmuramidase) [Mediterraneibacter glycyrrhizinilyticus]|nr:glycoside hydrolase family 25 protein [Mediterraneibacter glycyrrhizinilyticus]MBM6855618.1 Lyzozyme M1 (1,4-beta-N-acetylmuramidase) [Mediterraneibacter glycyrrhizinilyticus]